MFLLRKKCVKLIKKFLEDKNFIYIRGVPKTPENILIEFSKNS